MLQVYDLSTGATFSDMTPNPDINGMPLFDIEYQTVQSRYMKY